MSAIDRPFSEKRNFIRMKINTPVTIHYGDREYQAVCKDLSGAGMLIETEDKFTLGDELRVAIQQRGETHLPFDAIVEVSRVDACEQGSHTVGLSIKEIIG